MVTEEKSQLTQPILFCVLLSIYSEELKVISNTQERTNQGNNTTGAPPRSSSIRAKQCLPGPHDGIRSHHSQHVPLRSEHSICCTDGPFKKPPPVENIDTKRRKPSCTPTAAWPPEGTGWEMPRDGKCCSYSLNSFKGHSAPRRFD